MKKIILITFLALTVFTSCKKDEETKTKLTKLEGRWDLREDYYLEEVDGVKVHEHPESLEIGDWYAVFSGDKVSSYSEGKFQGQSSFTLSTDYKLTIKSPATEDRISTVDFVTDDQIKIIYTTENISEGVKRNTYSEQTLNRHK